MGFKAKLAILNGYVTGVEEKSCSIYPYTSSSKDFWKNRVEGLNKKVVQFEILETSIEDISEDFAIVFNPFGEAYPEVSIKEKAAFHLLKNYIEDGGIYVNSGGFPFYYAWNVKEGKEYPISEERVILPKTIVLKDGIVTGAEMQAFFQFTGTLFYKEFEAIPGPVSKMRKVYQNDDDKKMFGDLVSDLSEVNEFRGLPKSTTGCIPLIRAKDEIVEEIYPVSALRRGNGYLLLAGMNTSEVKEADLFVKALHSFCVWYSRQL